MAFMTANVRAVVSPMLNQISTRRYPLTPFAAYCALLTVLSVLACAFVLPNLHGPIALLLFFVALNVAAEQFPIEIYGNTRVSVSVVLEMAIIILFGAPGITLAVIASTGTAFYLRKFDPRALLNIPVYIVVYNAGAFAYSSVAPQDLGGFSWAVTGAVTLAALTTFAVNAVILGVGLRLRDGASMLSFWEQHSWMLPHYFSFAFIGLALALSYFALGTVGIFAFLTPAVMMRLAMKQYVDKTRDNVLKLEDQNKELAAANVNIRRMSDELSDSYDGTLEALVNALDARDQETKGHSLRVSKYMMDIAREIGVVEGSREWLDMQRGSLLHDVGKIGVSDSILLKPGKLTDDEWKLMRLHPEIGFKMLHQVKFLEGPAEIILAHHERWDGKGYPRGLAQDEIPLGARIFPVVDTFDAMTSDRPYRQALSTQDAMNEILKYSGTQFDPRVVEAFLDIYSKWVHMWAELHADEHEVVMSLRAA